MHTIYGKSDCPYCDKAKLLLDYYNIEYRYINVSNLTSDQKEHLIVQYKMKTVPIILDENNNLIGGYKEVRSLYEKTTR